MDKKVMALRNELAEERIKSMSHLKIMDMTLHNESIYHENLDVDLEAEWLNDLKELITKGVLDGIAIFESKTGIKFSDMH